MPGAESKETLVKAKELFERGKVAEARTLLVQGLGTFPDDPKILNFLAYIYYKLGDLEKARDAYRKVVAMEPDNLSAWSNLGLITYKLGFFDEALSVFQEHLRRKPDDPKVLSYVRLVEDKVKKASAAREKASPTTGEGAPAGREGTQRDFFQADETMEEGRRPSAPRGEEEAAATAVPEQAVAMDEGLSFKRWCEGFADQAPPPGRQFHDLSTGMVSARLEERLYFALSSLVAYRGIVLFDQGLNPYGKIPRAHRHDSLILLSAEGNGHLWLTHAAGWPVTLRLENEAFQLNAHRLVAFESCLECEWVPLGKAGYLNGLAAVRLSGSGRVILAAGEGLVSIAVKQGVPVFVRPPTVVAWTAGLDPEPDKGADLKKVRDFFDGPFLRFEGKGTLFLNGDRSIYS